MFMRSEVIHAAMAAWATRDLPARLHAAQVAKLLNCSPEDVAILASAGKLRPLGRPRPSAVKYFSTIELMTLLADREWLDEVTKTISAFWRRKNERRKGALRGDSAATCEVDLGGAGSGFKPPGSGRSVVPGPELSRGSAVGT